MFIRLLFTFLAFVLFNFCFAQVNSRHVYVEPYIRHDGTPVQGHYRTAPNGTNRDNFSTRPNTNPYTGKPGTILPDNNYLDTNSTPQSQSPDFNTNGYQSGAVQSTSTGINTKEFSIDSILSTIKLNLYNSYPTYKTKNTANLREQMSSSSAIVALIPKGEFVKVINSFFGDWWEIYYNGSTGYVRSSLLDFATSGSHKENLPSIAESLGTLTGDEDPYRNYPSYRTKNMANIREQMSTSSAVIATISKGSQVKVINSFFGDWWEVYCQGYKGYIHSSLLIR